MRHSREGGSLTTTFAAYYGHHELSATSTLVIESKTGSYYKATVLEMAEPSQRGRHLPARKYGRKVNGMSFKATILTLLQEYLFLTPSGM